MPLSVLDRVWKAGGIFKICQVVFDPQRAARERLGPRARALQYLESAKEMERAPRHARRQCYATANMMQGSPGMEEPIEVSDGSGYYPFIQRGKSEVPNLQNLNGRS